MSKKTEENPKKQELFVDYFTSGETEGNAAASARKAGYSNKNDARAMGYYLKKRLSDEIMARNRERLSSIVPKALSKLEAIVLEKNLNRSIQLAACNSVLDKSGFNAITKIEDVTEKMTPEERSQRIYYLIDKLGFNDLYEENNDKGQKH
jgi:phage terminase small subunit